MMKRYQLWKEKQKQVQSQIWKDQRGYYFCNIVAVSPNAQGKGVGKKLFEVITRDRADREGIKCYLESSKLKPNVDIYRRLGFDMVKEMECKDGDDACMVCILLITLRILLDFFFFFFLCFFAPNLFQLYCMVRDPQKA